jgi:hypothetical protein
LRLPEKILQRNNNLLRRNMTTLASGQGCAWQPEPRIPNALNSKEKAAPEINQARLGNFQT